MKKKVLALLLALAMAGSLAACGGDNPSSASAPGNSTPAENTQPASEPGGETYVLKFALQNGENHPLCQGVAKFGEILEEKSGGRITLDLAYSGSLGDKATTVQGMQTGTIDAAMLMGGVIADYGCDQLKVFSLPYLFTSVTQARNFEKSDAGRALLDTVQSSGTRIVCIGAYQESARNYFFKDTRVEKPEDMKGLQIRCQEGSIYSDAIEALGAYSETITFSELYSAIQSGVVDGAEQPLSGFVNNAFQEVSDYYVLDQHETSPNLILFSEVTWNRLSDADKALVMEAFNESVPFFEEISDAKDAEYLQTIKDSGTEVIEVNVADWQAACSSVYDKYGEEYKDIIDAIRSTPS